MKKVNLEHSNIQAYLPDIDFFLDKIKKNEKFSFLRINHGFIDGFYYSYSDYQNLKQDIIDRKYEIIGNKLLLAYADKDWGTTYFHGTNLKVPEYSALLLKLLIEYKLISNKLNIAISLGVGLNTHWGVWPENHHLQLARSKFAKVLTDITNQTYFYSGVIKHYTIKKEIFKMFEVLNNMDYHIIFIGPKYFEKYKDIFSIKKFDFIKIPLRGAIEHTEDYIETIKNIQKTTTDQVIVFHQCGHIISSKIVYELLETHISTIDVGRSFDILIKEEFVNGNLAEKDWTFLDENQLTQYVNNLRK